MALVQQSERLIITAAKTQRELLAGGARSWRIVGTPAGIRIIDG